MYFKNFFTRGILYFLYFILLGGIILMVHNQYSGTATKNQENSIVSISNNISLEDLLVLQQRGDTTIIDVRMYQYYALGHIPNSINVSDDKIKSDWQEDISTANIILYGKNSEDTQVQIVAMKLKEHNIPCFIFSGGWNSWKNCKLPFEKK